MQSKSPLVSQRTYTLVNQDRPSAAGRDTFGSKRCSPSDAAPVSYGARAPQGPSPFRAKSLPSTTFSPSRARNGMAPLLLIGTAL